MSKSVKFKLNLPGLNELMKSPAMQTHLSEAASGVANSAGEGYSSDVHTASFVAIGTAFPDTGKAYQDNLDNNTLLKALGSAGLSQKG